MSVKVAPVVESVARCVPRQDGAWMIITAKGLACSSPVELPEGAAILIRDGVAERQPR